HRDRRRGHAEGVEPFLSDFKAVLAAFEERLPRPWLALGHSMGGGLVALALARGEARFSGAVLTAPMLGLNLGAASPRLAAPPAPRRAPGAPRRPLRPRRAPVPRTGRSPGPAVRPEPPDPRRGALGPLRAPDPRLPGPPARRRDLGLGRLRPRPRGGAGAAGG